MSSISIVAGIALALYARERTGRGTKVSSSLTANGAWANSILIQAALCGGKSYVPPTQAGTSNALVNHYRAADGRSFYLVLIKEADEFEKFCTAIERPELIKDPRFEKLQDLRANAPDLVRILSDWFAARPLAQWQRVFEEHAITFGVIATCDEAAADRQMECNSVFVDMEGRPGTRVIDSPIALSDFPKRTPQPPPELGEHSSSVLSGLGYDESRIAALRESGVIGAS